MNFGNCFGHDNHHSKFVNGKPAYFAFHGKFTFVVFSFTLVLIFENK
jgi:hypothetical protein